MKRYTLILTFLVLALAVSPASAALYDLGDYGYAEGMIFDDQSNLVWLKDASAGGMSNWNAANFWIVGLNSSNYLGFSDWRLPEISNSNGGSPDRFSMAGSELGYLFNASLGNEANYAGALATGPFDNLDSLVYWSGSSFFGRYRTFDFSDGSQSLMMGTETAWAWAVRDGSDISLTPTPVPASLWLMASGIFCFLGYRRMGTR